MIYSIPSTVFTLVIWLKLRNIYSDKPLAAAQIPIWSIKNTRHVRYCHFDGNHVWNKQTAFTTLQKEANQQKFSFCHFWPRQLNEDSASLNVLGHFPHLWCCRNSWNSWGSGCRARCQSCSDTPSRRWVTGGCTLFALDCWFWYMAGTENSQLKTGMMTAEYKHIPEVELSYRAPATTETVFFFSCQDYFPSYWATVNWDVLCEKKKNLPECLYASFLEGLKINK